MMEQMKKENYSFEGGDKHGLGKCSISYKLIERNAKSE